MALSLRRTKNHWEKAIQSKLKIRFVYDDIEGEFTLLGYNVPKKGYVKISYCNVEYSIHSSNLAKCKIGDIIGKINRTMKYNKKQNIKDKNRDLIITDTKHIDGIKMYKYHCNKCEFSCGKHWNIRDEEYKDECWISEYSLNRGQGCSCCNLAPKIVLSNINSIFKTKGQSRTF